MNLIYVGSSKAFAFLVVDRTNMVNNRNVIYLKDYFWDTWDYIDLNIRKEKNEFLWILKNLIVCLGSG